MRFWICDSAIKWSVHVFGFQCAPASTLENDVALSRPLEILTI